MLDKSHCNCYSLSPSKISLGFWYSFNHCQSNFDGYKLLFYALKEGINSFDLANVYGKYLGEAEYLFGQIMHRYFKQERKSLIITTKGGYGDFYYQNENCGLSAFKKKNLDNSKKSLIESLNQSLKRLKMDYVDIFYTHAPDYYLPLENLVDTFKTIIDSGKALYIGLSRYNAETTDQIYKICKKRNIPLIAHQFRYSLIYREAEKKLIPCLNKNQLISFAFSPFAQGLLTHRYLDGIPSTSRVKYHLKENKSENITNTDDINEKYYKMINQLKKIADGRKQTISQLVLSWLVSKSHIHSIIMGVSSTKQLKENMNVFKQAPLLEKEITKLEMLIEAFKNRY